MKDALIGDAYAWVGEIPDQWEFRRLGSCFTERRATTTGELAPPLSVTKSGVIEQQEHVAKSVAGAPKKVVHTGDLVINSRSDRKGSAGLAPRFGSVSLINIVLQPTGIHPQFAFFLLRSTAFQEEFFRHGSGIVDDLWTTRYADAKTIKLPIPPLSVQKNIAEFLDRETAEIDAFTADQERLIELLEERRAATIAHAVTKGLDPTVPMKDSGMDWLGRVPSGWRVHAIKLGAYMSSGTGFPHKFQGVSDEAVAFHKVAALSTADADGVIREKRDTVSHTTASELGATVFPAGSIVLAKIGAALLLGRIRSVGHPFCIDNNMLAVASKGLTDLRFLYYALQIVDFSQIVNPGAVPSLDMTAFRDYKLAFPSREEQQNIAEFLDRETAEIDAAVRDAQEAIALSRERRAALISAVVTGQVDVTQMSSRESTGEVLEEEVRV